jgi:predicted nucleic acid-binding Zn ribbon protein
MATIRLPDHSHCAYCGDPIPFGEEYCNEECRNNERIRVAKEKRKDYIFYGVAVATILILFAIRALTR